jgi:hypothetical protein
MLKTPFDEIWANGWNKFTVSLEFWDGVATGVNMPSFHPGQIRRPKSI